MKKLILLLVCTTIVGHAHEDQRIHELDAYWAEVSRCVNVGDFKGYEATIHKDAVIVSGRSEKAYPLTEALKRWKKEFDDTAAGTRKSSVEFRLSKRLGDPVSAHESGIFLYKATKEDGTKSAAYIELEALLVKRDGKWLIMMEYQKGPATKEAFELLKPTGEKNKSK